MSAGHPDEQSTGTDGNISINIEILFVHMSSKVVNTGLETKKSNIYL